MQLRYKLKTLLVPEKHFYTVPREEYENVAFLYVSDDMEWGRKNLKNTKGDLVSYVFPVERFGEFRILLSVLESELFKRLKI